MDALDYKNHTDEARAAEAERLMTEALSWLTSYPGGGGMNIYDKFRTFLDRRNP